MQVDALHIPLRPPMALQASVQVIQGLLLVVGQFAGLFLMSFWLLLGLGLLCGALAWILLRKSMGRFTYERLLQ